MPEASTIDDEPPEADALEPIDGLTRAAIFAQIIGEDSAAKILEHLDAREVQKLVGAIKDLGAVPQAQVDNVVRTFADNVGLTSSLGMDANRYLRDVLVRSHGEERASSILDRSHVGEHARGIEHLKWMDARQVAEVIREEHPQIKAIVLSFLDSDHAANVLGAMPADARGDVVLRIATLESVQPAALQELNASLEKQLSGAQLAQATDVGGPRAAAGILNFIEPSAEAEIIRIVSEQDPELANQLQDLMFAFENLRELDAGGLRVLLREVSSDGLLLALKGADDELKEHIFKHVSRRAAEVMREDLDAMGPVRVSEVEAAQKEILTIARRLAEDGRLGLGYHAGDEFI